MDFESCKAKLNYCAENVIRLNIKDDPELWVVWVGDKICFLRDRDTVKVFPSSTENKPSQDDILTEATTWLLDYIKHLGDIKEVTEFSKVKPGMSVGKNKCDLVGTVKSVGNLRDYENTYDRTFYVGDLPSESVQLDDIITRYKDDQYIPGIIMEYLDFPERRIRVDKLIPWAELEFENLKVYS